MKPHIFLMNGIWRCVDRPFLRLRGRSGIYGRYYWWKESPGYGATATEAFLAYQASR